MRIEQAIFAAGCFWGVQYQLQRVSGVLATSVGYIGGPEENPTYVDVKAHRTHHVEAVWVEFDADKHEAIAQIPAPAPEQKGKIIDCTQKGYTLNDVVIRFPKVVVAQ